VEQLREERRYTYADYCTWDDNERWELIDGVPYAMSPAPRPRHQNIAGEIYGQLRGFLKGKPCKALISPLDVRLNADGEDDTVVQPDVVVICDRAKIDDKGCKGAPDLVVEVLSPSTSRRDRWEKLNLYRRCGVREYWIADPDTNTLQVCTLHEQQYIVTVYAEIDTVSVSALPGCEINLHDVFEQL